MRAQRVIIIIPAILTFGLAGSILASPAIATAATHAPAVHITGKASDVVAKPDTFYHT
jgi:Flp pilus assembly protein CpaB